MSPAELDRFILFFIAEKFHSPLMDAAMSFVTNKSYLIILPISILIFSKERDKALLMFLASVSAVLLSDWIGMSLKELIARPRPFSEINGINLSYSMPSNHAANVFSAVAPFYFFSKGRLKRLLLVTAVLVGFSRIYLKAHYPSDVLAGALLGLLIASAVSALFAFSFKKEGKTAFFVIFLAAVAVFRIYYITKGPLGLSPDEAHYWEWSRRPDISYYSKGPVVAYLIWLGTKIFGDTALGVRFPAVLLSLLSSIFIYRLAVRLRDRETAIASAVLLSVIPLFSAYGVLMTIDAPFIFFWILSLFFLNRAVTSGAPYEWLFLGLSAGLGLLTKYTMAFFYVSAFLFLIASPGARRHLLGPWPYLALLISLLAFSPVLIWNLDHGFVSLKHTLGHANVKEGFVISPLSLVEFIGSQAGVVTPVIFLLVIYSVIRLRREDPFSFWFSAPALVFFLLKSLQGKVQANWAMPGYISALIPFSALFIRDFRNLKPPHKALVSAGLALCVFVSASAHYPQMLKLPVKLDSTQRLRGWDNLGKKVSGLKSGIEGPFFIFSDSYQVSSELAFYVKGHPVTYCANLGRRMNQYDLWPGFHGLVRHNAIFVKIDDVELPEELDNAFERHEKVLFTVYDAWGRKVQPEPTALNTWGRLRGESMGYAKLRDYSIFLCYGFKGMKMKEARDY